MALDLTPSDGAPPRHRLLLALAVIILFSEIATFEILMVTPALPEMAGHFRTTDIAWVVSIVTLAGATVMPLVGRAADRWGKKRVILVLGCVFLAGSVLCATTSSFPLLLAGRAVQGAMVGIVGLSYGLVRDIMPRSFVPVALGMVVTGVGMSAVVGPFVAGFLIDGFGYQGVFWFMVAYMAVLLPLYALLIPETPVRADTRIDYLGSIMFGPAIALGLYGLSRGSEDGWTSPAALALLGGAAVLAAGFLVRQWTTRHPLIEPRVLFGRRFGPTLLAVGCVSYMMNAHALMSPTMLRTPEGAAGTGYGAGLSAIEYALWTAPLGLMSMAVGPVGGYLAKRIGARRVLIAAAVLFIMTMYVGAQLPNVYWQVALKSLLAGIAVGCLHSSNANLVQDALPSSYSGVGNTIGAMNALMFASIGSTVTGIVMADHVVTTGHGVVYEPGAFTGGFFFAALVGAAGLVIALVMRHGRAPARGGLDEAADRPAATAAT